MKKLENFSNCLNVLKNADFDLADNNDIYRTGVIGQFNLTFELAWKVARPNAIVTVVALYEENQTLPLPQMYGKNLIFKTGGVDGCDCDEILKLIEQGRIDTTPLITHTFPLEEIEQAYDIFENRKDNVIKIAVSHI